MGLPLTPRPGAEDVILALAGLWQLDPTSDWKGQAHRIYDIVLSGLQQPTLAQTRAARRTRSD
jgi:hypothetical protein